GDLGAIGRNLTALLLAKGHKVRALVRRDDERAEALRRLGAEVVQGDLTDLTSMHRAIEGCARIYFGMSVSAAYLEATVNTAAVARHHGVEAFVNMSQMTVTQMSITETTDSPQHKLHWLAEQALSWSGLPVVTVRPTVFLGRGPTKLGVIPLSDGAGEVAAIGDGVTRVKVGDRIAGCFHPRWFGGPIKPDYLTDRLGANLDGMLAEYAVFNEEAVVLLPSHLSFEEAATLPCAAVTAWVALTGHRRVTAGDTVLTQGSGGVSVFALQFARVLGARVIATTSTAEKAERLKALGASDVIN